MVRPIVNLDKKCQYMQRNNQASTMRCPDHQDPEGARLLRYAYQSDAVIGGGQIKPAEAGIERAGTGALRF